MNTSFRSVVFLRAAMLTLAALAISALTQLSPAETVKLKDGTSVEGTVVSEDDQQITLEVKLAGGTITSKRKYNKSDIAEIVRPTAEQRAEREMQQAYEHARKHQLDPNNSFPIAEYDRVLNEVFAPFLDKYPLSPHVTEVLKLSEAWQKERDLAASGKGKARGQWMDAAAAAELIAQDRAQYHLQQGRALLAQGKRELAIQQFQNAAAASSNATLIAEANSWQAQTLQQWLASLEQDKRNIERELASAEPRAKYAGESLKSAQEKLSRQREYYRKQGKSPEQDQYFKGLLEDVKRAEQEQTEAQNKLTTLRAQFVNLERLVADVKRRHAALPATTPATLAASTASPPMTTPAPETGPASTVAPAPTYAPEPSEPRSMPRSYAEPPLPRLPPQIAAIPRPDELQSVLNSKVSSSITEPGSDLAKYNPMRLIIVLAMGKGSVEMYIGLLIAIVGGLWLLAEAFRESALWGLCVLAVPLGSLIFSMYHWADAKWPFAINLAGWIVIYVGAARLA